MKKQFLLLVFILAGLSPALAQLADLGKGFKKDKPSVLVFGRAEEYFENQSYLQALPLYRSLEPLYGTNSYLIYKIGICLLYKSDETDKALEYLTIVKNKNPKAADIDLYLARAYHLNERYDEAIANLDLYDQGKDNSPEKMAESAQLRKYCLNAKELSAHPVVAKITNMGAPVNTANSEYVPVISTDDSVMLFTYRGENSIGGLQSYPGVPDSSGIYFEDVVFTSRQGTKWMPPETMDSTINGKGHDACIGISNDGQTLLIYKDEAGNGDLYVSTMEGFYWSAPVALKGPINSSSWEGSATFSADMRTIYFASERPGGYGGRDIWIATMATDSTWGNIKNLGPKINTQYNEDAPFLHPNGVTMLFSSEGHNSMGGYDIFKTNLTPVDSTFSDASEPINLGYPINTPGDDKYFVLATDGNHGYYSSGKTGGLGQQDIYVVEADFDLNNVNVMLFNGIVTMNNKPVSADITVKDAGGKLRTMQLYSKSMSGKYAVTLPLGHKYIVTYKVENADPEIRVIDSIQSAEMVTHTIDVQFFTKMFVDSSRVADSIAKFKQIVADSIRNLHPTPGISNGDYSDAMKVYGNAKSPGLVYHVQIAAYNLPQNYNAAHLKKFGKIDKRVLDDKITRFTLGTFETLNEAEAYRQEIIAAGQTDAFVTAEKAGKRYLIKDLFDLHFFQQ
jgi:tetratricopeptide (TPR) repeat protein